MQTSATPDADYLANVILPWLELVIDAAELARYEGRSAPMPLSEWEALVLGPSSWGSSLKRLMERSGIDVIDLLIVALAGAPTLDARFADRFRDIQRSPELGRCTVGLAIELLAQSPSERVSLRERFSPSRAIFESGLVVLESPRASGEGLLGQLLDAPESTAARLLGTARPDSRLADLVVVETLDVPLTRVIVDERHKAAVMAVVRRHAAYKGALDRLGFGTVIPYGRSIVLLFCGPSGTGKTLFARALVSELARPVFRVLSDKLAETVAPLEPLVTALFRDARAFDAVLFFDDCEALFGQRGARLSTLLTALERHDGIVILATDAPQRLDPSMDRRIVLRVDFARPNAFEREQIWELHLPPEVTLAPDIDVPMLANLYEFTGATIKNAVLVALNNALDRSLDAPIIDMAGLQAAASTQIRSNLEDYAQRSDVMLDLDDLVLPVEQRAKVMELLDACRNREFVQNKWGFGRRLITGRGISALFDGPPGTGKTLCAEILAKSLGRSLFRVHVPNVVSKWIGETEKNLSEMFARARASQSILLFDEADSLFGKRVEVQTANDRFANQGVNLLLQELERFEGIVFMTTNLYGALDDAVKRRIMFRVTFPPPTAAERERIWKALLPREAPISPGVDFAALAKRYELSGGNIKNAVIRAAYRACADQSAIGMDHLNHAALLECEAIGIAIRAPQKVVPSEGRSDVS